MFTGIVQARGRVAAVEANPSGVRLTLDPGGWPAAGVVLGAGDSVCVSGVCLTLLERVGHTLRFDVIAETLRRTTLGKLAVGGAVNLELSVTPSTPMGGHFVQGHVDGVGRVTQVLASPEEWRVTVEPPAELMDYMTPQGSVALDGVSLTLAAVGRQHFDVALIPTTLRLTTLGSLAQGAAVNVEADMLSKTVVNFLRRREMKPK